MAFAKLTLVVGKGGVGRSTVAQGLAMAASQRGESATYVQLGVAGNKRAFAPSTGNATAPGALTWLALEGSAALESVAAPLFGSRRIAKAALNNFAIARLLDVLPALREYALLAAALELTSTQQAVVVDMPATGHGLAWLSAAGRLADLVPPGRTRDQALRVDAALRDATLTTLVAVTLTEPIVLRETQQLRTVLKADLGRDIDHLVVNRAPVVPANAIQLAHELAGVELAIAEPAHQLATWLEKRAAARKQAHEVAGDVAATWIDEYPNNPPPLAIAHSLASAYQV